MSNSIVRLDARLDPEVSVPPAERLIAGTPELRVQNYYADGTQQFFAGRWAATRGKWRVRYTENELCVMTAGRVVITSDSGERSSFGPGDAFVVPAGFSGTWEVLEDCAKIYAIFEPTHS
ncbi:MAG TPA: cupin domain-containing protein [Steroidobacteraceae bacterium]|nr:cupin domain-containing protein [Steroidobacteraceae bacterium]